MAKNEKYSNRNFTQADLLDVDTSELDNSEIYNTCFHQEEVDTNVFPTNMTGVTFIRCNLDNCIIPPGNTVGEKCTNKRLILQKDKQVWIVDNSDKPVEPLHTKLFDHLGLSKDPIDITSVEKDTVLEKMNEIKALEEK